eukprot:4211438-Lingulodinium_polyedra.AAC.1
MGCVLKARLRVDASAAFGIAQRKGIGRVRHLSVGVLWIQEQQLRKAIEMSKIHGPDNPADLMTKGLAQDSIRKHMRKMHIDCRDGRVESAA